MDAADRPFFSGILNFIKTWIPWKSEPANVSRVFWMPDQSCRVCYECDSQFTITKRRHHCRICGRIFCARCTENSVPVRPGDPRTVGEDGDRIRVCNYCYKQWEHGTPTPDNNGVQVANQQLSTSPSATSLVSTRSCSTADSSIVTLGSMGYSIGHGQRVRENIGLSPQPSSSIGTSADGVIRVQSGRSNDLFSDARGSFRYSMSRSDDEDDDYSIYHQFDNVTINSPQVDDYYGQDEFDEMSNEDGSSKLHSERQSNYEKSLISSPIHNSFESHGLGVPNLEEKDENYIGDEDPSSIYPTENVDSEPVDFDNNGLLWLPPEPEDEEDEREALLLDEEEEEGDGRGEWGYLRALSSFGSGESRNRDKSGEEQKRAMRNVVDGHFRALVAQLLQVENLPVDEENDRDSWLEIITYLSWEAATLLKPDMSKGGGMDPGGYVKVKCVASGHRRDSVVVKGVVCKKNVAHRRMTSKIEKPRMLILGGALEYQRVTNHLSSFDTLLQQEMDHLKMAVAKLDAHQPNVLLVEKSVSRFAQEYLLAKDISLVLNIKRPLLERIARCTGAQIVPSIDHLSSQKLGYCDTFHVERFFEDLGTAGQGGKKLMKTLMYFEGCPKPLGFTILLRGANGDELKKVKHIVQYGVFAAYHLALETSFLADEGASLPELPFSSPITVALPDKPSSIGRSISTVPGFSIPVNENNQGLQINNEPERSTSLPAPNFASSVSSNPMSYLHGPGSQSTEPTSNCTSSTAFFSAVPSSGTAASDSYQNDIALHHRLEERHEMGLKGAISNEFSAGNSSSSLMGNYLTVNGFGPAEESGQCDWSRNSQNYHEEPYFLKEEPAGQLKEEFPPSPADHQSILVSLSSRCVWKGTVCERSHLFRIKYYGTFDKPLGRFLRDHLFDQGYRCRSCEMPSEAHVHCYTHRQGTLTISVKKLQEILLPGEKDGKIWMWHRCLRCPRNNGFPPATRRVVMSDAAWGLSFGKFLELSFSNHAAASRVASCGHSLHRDCLRFYGFGKMVACFRYASIDVHSVYLPPHKLNFRYEKQEWIQKETDEVVNRAELLFSEVQSAIHQIADKRASALKTSESRHRIAELEEMLQKEEAEFQELLQKIVNREVKKNQPVIDILETNRLRRQLLFQSYMWDRYLIYAAREDTNTLRNSLSCSSSDLEVKSLVNGKKLAETNVSNKPREEFVRCESFYPVLVDEMIDRSPSNTDVLNGNTIELDLVNKQKGDQVNLSTSMSIGNQSEPFESSLNLRRVLSDGQFPVMENLSDTLDAAWTGETQPAIKTSNDNSCALSESSEGFDLDDHAKDQNMNKIDKSISPSVSTKALDNMEYSASWLGMSFLNFYRSLNKNFLASAQKLNTLGEYNPIYISSFLVSELQGGPRLLLPVGVNDTVIPIYDDEPTSIISYALVSPEYHAQLVDDTEKLKDSGDFAPSFLLSDTGVHTSDEAAMEPHRSLGSSDDSMLSTSGSRNSLMLDPLSYTKALHARLSFGDDGPLGKVKYSVTCYYAKRFEALRRICCPSELDYIRSLSRCKKWGAQGGKSNVFFAKTLDDRFIIKQVTKTELESFLKFAPAYFKYLSESIGTGCPTCLAKILGIYQVTLKHLKGGKESKMDLLVMENLLFGRNIARLYDLKGSSRSRYNPDCSGSNKVLLDQNLIEAMPTSPIFVGNKAKRLLERAVWNDTSFLASVDVMDYSLLVGVDEEQHELVLGIIDFMRQYTWDKHLETWVKASGILGGPKNSSPTVISPKQYKKRFRKAMTTYFLMVPDQWSPPSIAPSISQSDIGEESTHGGPSVE